MVDRRILADLVLTPLSRALVEGTPEEAWSLLNGCYSTHTGPPMDGTPVTGRAVTYSVVSFTQIEGEKRRSEHTYLDRCTMAEQLGLKCK